jgi:hypothetical protein
MESNQGNIQPATEGDVIVQPPIDPGCTLDPQETAATPKEVEEPATEQSKAPEPGVAPPLPDGVVPNTTLSVEAQ